MKAIEYLLYIVIILFVLALISPVKACFVVNAISIHSYIFLSDAGNGIVNAALYVRGLVNV